DSPPNNNAPPTPRWWRPWNNLPTPAGRSPPPPNRSPPPPATSPTSPATWRPQPPAVGTGDRNGSRPATGRRRGLRGTDEMGAGGRRRPSDHDVGDRAASGARAFQPTRADCSVI